MKPTQIVILAVVGAVLGAIVGAGWKKWHDQHGRFDRVANAALHSTIPDFAYPDLDGRERRSNEWVGKVLVLNFWASWCPPCREETPLFVELQERYRAAGVQFVGIAIDDREPIADFSDTYGINYPVLLGDISAVDLSKRLGNRFEGLPFTVIAGPDGKVVLRHAGGIAREQLTSALQQLTSSAKKS